MGFVFKPLVLAFVIIFIAYMVIKLLEPVEIPKIDETWWGEGNSENYKDVGIRPFTISVPDKVIEDLKFRLKNGRSVTPALVENHLYGIHNGLLNDIIEYWKNGYDWHKRVQYLNQYPQFKVNVQGLDVHFVHVKPKNVKNKRVLPILLLHGWPGSVTEFYELIPILTTEREEYDFVFEIIAPSLPGFGFSDRASKPGLGAAEVSVVMKNFMKKLGHNKFFVQGGDWGAVIAQAMATLFPEVLIGLHSNMCLVNTPCAHVKIVLGSLLPFFIIRKEHEHKMYPLSKHYEFLLEETGYLHLQATKPDTIGAALSDSPIGLAAYILEKFIVHTNRTFKYQLDGGLKQKYTYDKLIDNLMMYWISESITSSLRLYAESFSKRQFDYKLDWIPTHVPTSCARFSDDMFYQSDFILKDKFVNLVHSSDYDGGHFAALEQPRVLADDIFLGISKIENFIVTEKL